VEDVVEVLRRVEAGLGGNLDHGQAGLNEQLLDAGEAETPKFTGNGAADVLAKGALDGAPGEAAGAGGVSHPNGPR
jgi:hypothetical protein